MRKSPCIAKTEPTSYQEINKTNDADFGGDQQDDDGMCIILPTYDLCINTKLPAIISS